MEEEAEGYPEMCVKSRRLLRLDFTEPSLIVVFYFIVVGRLHDFLRPSSLSSIARRR